MKNYLLKKLTQSTVWMGLLVIVAAFVLPRDYIAIMGLAFMVTDDSHINAIFTRFLPWVADICDEIESI